MVGRIDQQKGVDMALEALRQTAAQRWQFVLLGSGDPALEAQALRLQTEYPERVRVALRYDAPLGRLIYAGADIFLMPSRYEPCGLAQMYAMRYGCVPIVHATGGLKDTVEEGRTGFLFREAEPEDLAEAIGRALRAHANPTNWQHFQRNGMNADFSWSRSARQYAMIYRALAS
jgi:starch synthase